MGEVRDEVVIKAGREVRCWGAVLRAFETVYVNPGIGIMDENTSRGTSSIKLIGKSYAH